MPCLSTNISRANTPLVLSVYGLKGSSASFNDATQHLFASMSRAVASPSIKTSVASHKMRVGVSCLCSVGLDNGRELFMVKDGVFLLSDGKTFKVIKYGV